MDNVETEEAAVKAWYKGYYWNIPDPGDWKPGDPIEYVNKTIPDFTMPDYSGERYEALIPDTLDLQERAALGVNVLTGATDPLADYEMYFYTYFLSNPPSMVHCIDDHCQNKFTEALPLLRLASGSRQMLEVDRRWMEVVLHQTDKDGLPWEPTRGRPWVFLGMEKFYPGCNMEVEQFFSPIHCGRLLSSIMIYHERDGGDLWKNVAERMVDGIADFAVDRGDYIYFGPHSFYAERGNKENPVEGNLSTGLELRGMASGLVKVYLGTGYEPALELAGKLVHFFIDVCHGFDDEGRYSGGKQAHFHLHTGALQAILEYGVAAGDDSLIELARKGYEYGRAHGETRLGYFPELINSEQLEESELCEVADMIALAIKLTEAGAGDYWDDADRWARNMFAEGQLTTIDWIENLYLMHLAHQNRLADVPPSGLDPMYTTTENVLERNIGAFAGWPRANDWYVGHGIGVMQCCTGNATRAIYYLWENILSHQDGKLRVNMPLNRASRWADVDSHIPYEGKVDVKVKEQVDLAVRIPEWVKPAEARCSVNGGSRTVKWDGRYALLGAVNPGETATVQFPLPERSDTVTIEKENFRILRKGNDVVRIDPPGRWCPLYRRDHYRVNSTRWRTIERFVTDESIHW